MRPTCKIYMCDVDRCAYMSFCGLYSIFHAHNTQTPHQAPDLHVVRTHRYTSRHRCCGVQQNRDTAGDLQPADTLVCGPIIKPRVCGTSVGAPDSTFPFVRRAGPFEFENETQFGSVLALFARVIQ